MIATGDKLTGIEVIEDDKKIAGAFSKALLDSGFEVVTAHDSYQGTKFAYENNPGLIILDLMLPAGGGHAVLKNIRLSTKTKHIPVIVITGSYDEELKQKVISEGVAAYLEKPVEMARLIEVIKNTLQMQKK